MLKVCPVFVFQMRRSAALLPLLLAIAATTGKNEDLDSNSSYMFFVACLPTKYVLFLLHHILFP